MHSFFNMKLDEFITIKTPKTQQRLTYQFMLALTQMDTHANHIKIQTNHKYYFKQS